MRAKIIFEENFWKDYQYWARNSMKIHSRISDMIDLLVDHPARKNDHRIQIWSIDAQNDLIFSHSENEIILRSCKGLDPNEI